VANPRNRAVAQVRKPNRLELRCCGGGDERRHKDKECQ
jgi:hypothetical protein